jgi:uncharacterized membrane-anchored protein YhcB (DUF1043 family)
MRQFNDLDEAQQQDMEVFCQASPVLKATYDLVQDYLQMLRHRAGNRKDGLADSSQEQRDPRTKAALCMGWNWIKPPYKRD